MIKNVKANEKKIQKCSDETLVFLGLLITTDSEKICSLDICIPCAKPNPFLTYY